MFYQGKLYQVKKANGTLQAIFKEMLREQIAQLYNPLVEFMHGLEGLSAEDRQTALAAFIQAGRDRDYPEVYQIAAQNSLESARFLVKNLIPDFDHEVTEENKSELLQFIQLHHTNREMENILEIKNMRAWQKAQEGAQTDGSQ